jgi:hypothetical protein
VRAWGQWGVARDMRTRRVVLPRAAAAPYELPSSSYAFGRAVGWVEVRCYHYTCWHPFMEATRGCGAWGERLQPLVAIELVRCVGGAAGRVWMRGILTCVDIRPCERFGGSLLVPRGVARTHQRTCVDDVNGGEVARWCTVLRRRGRDQIRTQEQGCERGVGVGQWGGWTRGGLSTCTGVRPCERPSLQLPHGGHLTTRVCWVGLHRR